jgi:hypothetical protein
VNGDRGDKAILVDNVLEFCHFVFAGFLFVGLMIRNGILETYLDKLADPTMKIVDTIRRGNIFDLSLEYQKSLY